MSALNYQRLALGLFLVAFGAPLRAQATPPDSLPQASVGARVRISAPSVRRDRFIGRIDSLDAERVVLDTTGVRTRFGFETGPVLVDAFRRTSLQRSAVERLEMSGGRTVRTSTLRGALFGALIGAVVVGVGNLPQVNASFDDFLKYAPIGAVLGGVVGGAVGYALGGERWVPARFAP